jgi:hypothetical protein
MPAAPPGLVAEIDVALLTAKLAAATAPKLTAVAPLRFVPVMVTDVPPAAGPELGTTDVTVGAGGGVWNDPWSFVLVALVPPGVVTVTSTVPLPDGLTAEIRLSEMTTNEVAAVPPKLTALAAVKPVPLMKTLVPGTPPLGPTEVTTGVGDEVYVYLSLALVALVPPGVTTVTSTWPVACVGLLAKMRVSLMMKNPGPVAAAAPGVAIPRFGIAGVVPKLTAVAPLKPVPVTKT